MSLCLLRTLLPRVMTATEARHGLILLPIIKCSCSAHAYNRGSTPTGTPDPRFQVAGDSDRGSTPTPTPDLPAARGIGPGGPPPSPPPICQNWRSTPTPGSNRGFRRCPALSPEPEAARRPGALHTTPSPGRACNLRLRPLLMVTVAGDSALAAEIQVARQLRAEAMGAQRAQ